MPPRVHIMMTYLVLLSSSRSDQNIGRRVVSIWHGRWQYLSRHSHQHPVCCRNNLSSVCLAMSTLVFQPSSCHLLHIMARLAGLVVGSRRMCPTNRLRRVATVSLSCSAACPVRAITSSFARPTHPRWGVAPVAFQLCPTDRNFCRGRLLLIQSSPWY